MKCEPNLAAALRTAISGLTLGLLLTGCSDPVQQFDRGLRAYEAEDYGRARKLLDKALKGRSDDAEAAGGFNILGAACWQLGDRAGAEQALRTGRRLDSDNYDSLYNLGVLLCEKGDLLEGSNVLKDAAAIAPDRCEALEYLASEYLRRKLWSEARGVLNEALKREPNSARILTYMAVAGLPDQGAVYAAKYFKDALLADPDYPTALYNLGLFQEKWLKDPELAADYYQRFVSQKPGGTHETSARDALDRLAPPPPVPAAPPLPEPSRTASIPPPQPPPEHIPEPDPIPDPPAPAPAAPEAALAATVPGLIDQARIAVARGDAANGLNLCLHAATVAQRNDNLQEEETALRAGIALCQDMPRAHFAFARYLGRIDRHREALAAYLRAAELQPSWGLALRMAANEAVRCDEYQQALESLRRAVNVAPEDPDALWELAQFYDQQLNLRESALRSYQQFITRFSSDERSATATTRIAAMAPATEDAPPDVPDPVPGERSATVSVGNLHNVRTLTPRVEISEGTTGADLRPAVSERRHSEAVRLFNRGALHQSRKEFDQAIQYYLQAAETNPSFASPLYNLGLIAQRRNQMDGAIGFYRDTLEVNPTMVNARYNLALVYKDLNQIDQAEQELLAVIEHASDHLSAHFILGQIYSARPDRTEEARKYYSRFIELAPSDPAAPKVRRWLHQH